ncbi:hypothetical protein ACFUJ0_25950 [Streptomyces sp. NPDC057242]|uniref:hypothetical protein n=1 Tax=unclassified Streptomyces TaxID=2593676 RepID=UPI0036363D2E
MISTLRDVAAFYRVLVGGRVVSAESTAEMKRGVPTQPGSPSSAGLGLVESPLPCGGTFWTYNGAVPGYFTLTGVTEDGRYASTVTNAQMGLSNQPISQGHGVLRAALCEGGGS